MFDPVYLHLLLNHIPILGSLFGICLLAFGLIRKNQSIENAGYVAIVVVALGTIPVSLSGEESEDRIEEMAGSSEFYMEEHEEVAEIAYFIALGSGALALITLIINSVAKRRLAILSVIVLLSAVTTFGFMTAAGYYGGRIRHSELHDRPLDNTIKSEVEHGED